MFGKRGQSTGTTASDPEKSATMNLVLKVALVIILIVVLSAILFRTITLSGLAG